MTEPTPVPCPDDCRDTCPTRQRLTYELTAARNALAAVREVAADRREGRL